LIDVAAAHDELGSASFQAIIVLFPQG